MKNQIEKFSLEDEKLLLSEMEMLEIYGGNGPSTTATYSGENGCKCKNCGSGSSSSGSQYANCGSGNQTGVTCGSGNHAGICSSGSSGSSGSTAS